jgi:histidinol-phosphate aminotransferase
MIRPRPHLQSIHRSPAQAESRLDSLRLDKNEFLPCWPEEWFQEFCATLRPEHLSIHPETGRLYDLLADRFRIPREQLVVTAGSDAAIRSAFEAFVEPGDEVVILNPTFAMYNVYADIFAARLVAVDYDSDMNLPLERLMAAVGPATKLVAVANPNSPTGTVFSIHDLERLIGHASANGAAVLIDEAYFPFHTDTMLDCVNRFDNLIVTRSFSKAAGIAGMRLGFAASSPAIAPVLFAVKPMYEVTVISTLLGEYILEHYDRVDVYTAQVLEGRELLAHFFRSQGFAVPQSHGNFLHVDFGAQRQSLISALREKKVLFKESFDHPSLARYCRFTVGPRAYMEAFMAIFAECQNKIT